MLVDTIPEASTDPLHDGLCKPLTGSPQSSRLIAPSPPAIPPPVARDSMLVYWGWLPPAATAIPHSTYSLGREVHPRHLVSRLHLDLLGATQVSPPADARGKEEAAEPTWTIVGAQRETRPTA
ncbi:hypothetical protein AK830_g11851 [Neonectria ditissima]|uniref:Uncharacterized protein n=1 Tax=Neonectria ditissima TaxID=78410 RepID=A0A0P7AQJ1_9HYPO|nr:hypothetical protein AK830_g11851 [Neonectria ditissima]